MSIVISGYRTGASGSSRMCGDPNDIGFRSTPAPGLPVSGYSDHIWLTNIKGQARSIIKTHSKYLVINLYMKAKKKEFKMFSIFAL